MIAKMLASLAWRSLLFRRSPVIITICAITVSVFTLLSVEHLRQTAKQSFNSTVSGIDLIVGPRSSDLNILLTSVFRIGQATQNISWKSYQHWETHPSVAWSIPISLGDSHKGFRVVGTNESFFSRFRYGKNRALDFSYGKQFSELYDVVLGAKVAEKLGYGLGKKIVISHGIAATSFQNHEAHPFSVSGVLKTTGTPVDNAVYISLAGLEVMHSAPGQHLKTLDTAQIKPKSISATMLGLKSKLSTFSLQREINTFSGEPLTAVLPGVALTQLWQMSRGLEATLTIMAQLILFASLLGLGAVMLATLRERSYEFSVLRSLGAGSFLIFILIQAESLIITTLGVLFGGAIFLLGLLLFGDSFSAQYGIDITASRISADHAFLVLYVFLGAMCISALPALIAYLRYGLRRG